MNVLLTDFVKSRFPFSFFLSRCKVVEAMENAKTNRNPQQIKEYDNDLRRVRQLQQMQAEQEAKAKAKQLAEEKAARIAQEKKAAKEKKDKQLTSGSNSTTTSKKNNDNNAKPSLNINNFSTPSYRYVHSIFVLLFLFGLVGIQMKNCAHLLVPLLPLFVCFPQTSTKDGSTRVRSIVPISHFRAGFLVFCRWNSGWNSFCWTTLVYTLCVQKAGDCNFGAPTK